MNPIPDYILIDPTGYIIGRYDEEPSFGIDDFDKILQEALVES